MFSGTPVKLIRVTRTGAALAFEFYDTASMAPHLIVNAALRGIPFVAPAGLNSFIVGKSGPLSLGTVYTPIVATFSMGALRGKWGVVSAADGTSGSVITVVFSGVPASLLSGATLFLGNMIAMATIIQRSPKIAMPLVTSVLPFQVAP